MLCEFMYFALRTKSTTMSSISIMDAVSRMNVVARWDISLQMPYKFGIENFDVQKKGKTFIINIL